MNAPKLRRISQMWIQKSLGCSMPDWKQGHAQIFQLSPIIALRKKVKVLGNAPGKSLRLKIMKTYTEDTSACYSVGQT